MRKTILIVSALLFSIMLHAQWVNDPQNNTLIANASSDADEVLLSTDKNSGDTYVQWSAMASNGWSIFLQRLNSDGVPQWGENGIHLEEQTFNSYSEGTAMTATNDQGVISCFANASGECIAIKINAEGSFVWGKLGVSVFDFPSGSSCSRPEVLAGIDGGAWVLASDNNATYLRYINANGTMRPPVTISDPEKRCVHGKLLPKTNNSAFVIFEKEVLNSPNNIEKELWVTSYNQNGELVSPEVQLMSTQTYAGAYHHRAVSDGMGGGFVFIPHSGTNDAFNTYVFHFNADGVSTINNMNGIRVHPADPDNIYIEAYGTIHPLSHDLIIAYCQTDAATQTENKVYLNRITATGQRVWGSGIMAEDNALLKPATIKVDAYESGSGFSLIYSLGRHENNNCLVVAKGFNVIGDELWFTYLNEVLDNKTLCRNSTGFHLEQNIVAWVNVGDGKIYGQNIRPDGSMGLAIAPIPCPNPSNFIGESHYDEIHQCYGALFHWTAPGELPNHYNLYVLLPGSPSPYVTTIDGGETSHFEKAEEGITIQYQLTAVFDDCESNPALSPDGLEWLTIEIVETDEYETEDIVTILKVYNLKGQLLKETHLENLNPGIYILQGLTKDGKLIHRKAMVSPN